MLRDKGALAWSRARSGGWAICCYAGRTRVCCFRAQEQRPPSASSVRKRWMSSKNPDAVSSKNAETASRPSTLSDDSGAPPKVVRLKRVALIGTGYIGGSFVKALKFKGIALETVGYDRDWQTLAQAQDVGIVDAVASSAPDAVRDAELVVLGTPVGALLRVLAEISRSLKSGRSSRMWAASRARPQRLFSFWRPKPSLLGRIPWRGLNVRGPRRRGPTFFWTGLVF